MLYIEADASIDHKEKIIMAVKKILASSSLADIMDRILDKGVTIDSWARISLSGMKLRAMETRIPGVGVDEYLKYAEAVGLTAKPPEG
jgi:gas vesicle structural protein